MTLTYQDGIILLKEKYGSSPSERYYVKPPEQNTIVLMEENKPSSMESWFAAVFLPQGYPDSVSPDYLQYQIWDTCQAFCSTITGTIATQEVLRGVGVGDGAASPLAATITWVLKDGCGHLARIVFAYTHGTSLDAYSKKWRLYADVLNDAAMCMEMSLNYFRNSTMIILCASTMMKAIVGVAGGATRIAMTQHHAPRGNMADVAAKDAAQETAVNLAASMLALVVISIFGNSMAVFVSMLILHIVANYFAVRAVCLRTFNEPRLVQVIHGYLVEEVIRSPCEVNKVEPIVVYQLGAKGLDVQLSGFKIRIGRSLAPILKRNATAADLLTFAEIYAKRHYILYPELGKKEMYVLLCEEAKTDDVLCAYFHATLLAIITCALNDVTLDAIKLTSRPFAAVCRTLQAADWTRVSVASVGQSGFRFGPSEDLHKYLDEIVHKEWIRVRSGLVDMEWDMSKHLLIMDQWRVSGHRTQLHTTDSASATSTHTSTFSSVDIISGQIRNDRRSSVDVEPCTIEPDSGPSEQSLHGSMKPTNVEPIPPLLVPVVEKPDETREIVKLNPSSTKELTQKETEKEVDKPASQAALKETEKKSKDAPETGSGIVIKVLSSKQSMPKSKRERSQDSFTVKIKPAEKGNSKTETITFQNDSNSNEKPINKHEDEAMSLLESFQRAKLKSVKEFSEKSQSSITSASKTIPTKELHSDMYTSTDESKTTNISSSGYKPSLEDVLDSKYGSRDTYSTISRTQTVLAEIPEEPESSDNVKSTVEQSSKHDSRLNNNAVRSKSVKITEREVVCPVCADDIDNVKEACICKEGKTKCIKCIQKQRRSSGVQTTPPLRIFSFRNLDID